MPPADGTKTGTKKRLIALGYRTLAIRTSPVGALTPDSVSVKVPPARKGSVSVSGGRGPANRRGLESESAWRPLPTQRPPGGLQHSALETFRSTCPTRGKPCGGVPGERLRPLRGLGLRRCRGVVGAGDVVLGHGFVAIGVCQRCGAVAPPVSTFGVREAARVETLPDLAAGG